MHAPPGGGRDGRPVSLCGRIYLLRCHGGLLLADLHDQTGRVQLYASRDALDAEAFADFAELDIGDWVGVEGTVMVTRTGEESVKVDRCELLSKALRPLPNKGRDEREVARQGARARLHDVAVRAPVMNFATWERLFHAEGVEGFLNVPVIGHLLVPQVVTEAGAR